MKIQTKIFSIIFVLILTAIVTITSSYIVSKQMIETEIYHHLETITASRAHHIESLLDEEAELVKTFAIETVFIDAITTQNITPARKKIKTLINIHENISRIRILDQEGQVVVSSHSKIDSIGNAEIFAYGKNAVYIRDMHISTITGTKVISISAPILIKEKFVGIVIVNIEAEEKLYKILSQRHHETDDIYLINKDGYMITPSRFIEDTFLKLKVDSLEARKCFTTSEISNREIYEDYRGELVIGTHHLIEGVNWCLLTEIDTKEAFVPVNKLVQLMVSFFILLLSVSGILAFFISKSITLPILKLHRRAKEIEKGNWDYQITVDTQDEIGQFSRAFDSMMTQLQNAHEELQSHQDQLEMQVAERTSALQESEERFRALFEGAPDAIFLAKAETGIIIDANPAASKLLLKPRDEIIGLHQSQLHPASRNQESQKKFSEHARLTKQTSLIEYVVLRSDGIEVPVEISAHVLNIRGKSILQGVFRDISERKQAELALQRSEEKYRRLIEHISNEFFFYSHNTDGIFTFLSHSVQSTLGYTPEEFMTHYTNYLTNSPVNEKVKYHTELSIQGIVQPLYDVEIYCKDGTIKTLEVSEVPVFDEQGHVVSVEGIAHDITERKQVEEILRQSEEQFRKIFEEGPIGMAIGSADLRFVEVNTAFCQMLGYTKKELIGRTISSISHPEDMNKNKQIIAETLTDQKSYYQMEKRYIRKDGQIVWGNLAVSFFEDDKGKMTHLLAKIENITQRKQAEFALIQAKEEAESANRAKSEFLANMSHEIRTPMNAVIGFSDILATLITNKQHRNYLNSIQTAGKSLLTLINDILDLSKIEAGRLEIQYEPVNPQVIFTELQQIFSLKMAEKNIDFMTEIDESLPPALFLDETRLRQVLLNLIGNAVKFTESGHIKLCANQKTYPNHIDLIIAVEDSGIGIPADQQTLIFESFRQQDGQSTRKYGGTGLGLAISKRLVEMMNGQISVASIPGKGSHFEILLQKVEIATSLPSAKPDNIFDLSNIMFEKTQILVVDDIESNRYFIEECLSQVNLEVISVENGHKALLFAEEYHPALILMDIRMPEMDGYETTKHLKDNPNTTDIPVIALTASATLNEKYKTEAHRFDGYLAKPVNISELLTELSCYIKYTQMEKAVTDSTSTLNPEEIATLPELRSRLKQEVIPLWENTNVTIEIEVIVTFAEKMRELGSEYNIPTFIHYGDSLQESAQNFDIPYIQEALKEFSVLLKLF